MLAVAVDGDNAKKLRQRIPYIAEGGFQRPALALIDLMRQHRACGHRGGFFKKVPALCAASVVHNDDMLEALPQETFEHFYKFDVRIQRRQHNGRTAPAVRFSILVQGIRPPHQLTWKASVVSPSS